MPGAGWTRPCQSTTSPVAAQIATEIHHRSACAFLTKDIGNQVGAQALADPARVEAHFGGDRRRRGLRVDRDRELWPQRAGRSGGRRLPAAVGADVVEV